VASKKSLDSDVAKLEKLARDPSAESWRLLCEALEEMPLERSL